MVGRTCDEQGRGICRNDCIGSENEEDEWKGKEEDLVIV